MNSKSTWYFIQRQLHDPKMKDPMHRQMICHLAKIYANDKDVYNSTLEWLHSFDSSAYIAA